VTGGNFDIFRDYKGSETLIALQAKLKKFRTWRSKTKLQQI